MAKRVRQGGAVLPVPRTSARHGGDDHERAALAERHPSVLLRRAARSGAPGASDRIEERDRNTQAGSLLPARDLPLGPTHNAGGYFDGLPMVFSRNGFAGRGVPGVIGVDG